MTTDQTTDPEVTLLPGSPPTLSSYQMQSFMARDLQEACSQGPSGSHIHYSTTPKPTVYRLDPSCGLGPAAVSSILGDLSRTMPTHISGKKSANCRPKCRAENSCVTWFQPDLILSWQSQTHESADLAKRYKKCAQPHKSSGEHKSCPE